MKVFENKDEGAPTTAILAGLSDAVVMGVDAINMSLGSSCGFTREEDDDAVNEIYDSIKEAGICLIVAASNDYSSAYNTKWGNTNLASNPDSGTVGSPASYEASMAVASISGVKTAYLVADGEKDIYFKESAKSNGDNKNFVSEMLGDKSEGTFDYVVVPGTGETGNYAGIDVTGKIAVIKRGISTFENKVDLAQEMGAIGVVIYNNVSGTISMSIGKSTIPSCSVTMDVGKYLEEKGSGTFYLSKSNLAGPFMSEFSSWGVLPDLELKPDITAHGGDIYSAVREGYDHYSGTSMACPNMAGAIILIRQYVKEKFPELSPYEVTELTYQLVMSTATIAYNEVGQSLFAPQAGRRARGYRKSGVHGRLSLRGRRKQDQTFPGGRPRERRRLHAEIQPEKSLRNRAFLPDRSHRHDRVPVCGRIYGRRDGVYAGGLHVLLQRKDARRAGRQGDRRYRHRARLQRHRAYG